MVKPTRRRMVIKRRSSQKIKYQRLTNRVFHGLDANAQARLLPIGYENYNAVGNCFSIFEYMSGLYLNGVGHFFAFCVFDQSSVGYQERPRADGCYFSRQPGTRRVYTIKAGQQILILQTKHRLAGKKQFRATALVGYVNR